MERVNMSEWSQEHPVIRSLEESFAPTPIVRLSDAYAGNDIYIKRDDLIPFSFGGNKARKAAYYYREIRRDEPDVIMTYGSNASNHCRIIANMAAAMRLPCHIISSGEEEQGTGGRELFNRTMVQGFGASVETVPVEQVHDTIEERLAGYRERGLRPYFVQGGGHGNTGTTAYVRAYEEILEQERAMERPFTRIFHASGTGSTQAGLICGKELTGGAHDIVGISIARTCPRGKDVVRESVLDYYRMLGREPETIYREEDLTFDDAYRLGGYGHATPEEETCIRDLMRREGIPMDTTYVGKAFYGMLQYLDAHEIRGEQILFIHTGGTPLYFDRL